MVLLFTLSLFVEKSAFFEFSDKFSLTVCLSYGIGRLGCLFSGDGCFGKYTTLPWGMYFPYGVSPNIIPVHPTPLYESICSLILFIFLKNVDSKKRFIGQTFVYYLFLSSMVRFFIEFVRINPIYKLGLTLSQWIALSLLVFSIGEYIWLKKKNYKQSPQEIKI